MKLKQIGGIIALIVVTAAITVMATSWGMNRSVATSKYGNISKNAFYTDVKTSTAAQNQLKQAMLDKILAAKYGKQITTQVVNSEYEKSARVYGDSAWNTMLKQSNYTETSFKAKIKANLLIRAAVKANVKITTQDLQQAFKTYQPTVTVQSIMVGQKNVAQTVTKQLASGQSFEKMVVKYSLDTNTNSTHGQMVPFNATAKNVDPAIMQAAFKLKNRQVSAPIKGKNGYYIIKMVNNPGKGTMKEHQAYLETQIINDYMTGSHGKSLNMVLKKLYDAADIRVHDSALTAVEKY
ncbi:hypothetical protein EQG49_00500 [Periweissella cryptocerci]|uniref:Foldase protein PrsA n=1 Tax=Periweissella cryptocerci TaxID=2506420 RepID=A0A4P6YR01_9LACO|nr:peptidylprolyl isomerase [Periweissella cryptocerci]QBO35034.1 hypothetical protein EQG49_00500 [Periweissella cryptocerci]